MNTLYYLLDKPCNWKRISMNTLKLLLKKYPDQNWNWNWNLISCNPNITLKFIEKNINKIKFNYLSSNTFKFQNKVTKHKEDKMNFRLYMGHVMTRNHMVGAYARCYVAAYLLTPGIQSKYKEYL